MEERAFDYNPVMYPVSILGFVAGTIMRDKFTDLDWLPWVVYAFAGLMLLVALLRHRTIIVNAHEIRIKELIKGERIILKAEVKYYRTTYEYRKTPFTTWYFTMNSGHEVILSHDYMKNEKELTDTINTWCSTLPYEPNS